MSSWHLSGLSSSSRKPLELLAVLQVEPTPERGGGGVGVVGVGDPDV